VDEICEAFETDAFHAGMDEVFYLGEARCPRCGGKDKAELFAGEVQLLRDHLHAKAAALDLGRPTVGRQGHRLGMGGQPEQHSPAVDLIPGRCHL